MKALIGTWQYLALMDLDSGKIEKRSTEGESGCYRAFAAVAPSSDKYYVLKQEGEASAILTYSRDLELLNKKMFPGNTKDGHDMVFHNGKLWLLASAHDHVVIIDPDTMKIIDTWKLEPPKSMNPVIHPHLNSFLLTDNFYYFMAHNRKQRPSEVWVFNPDRSWVSRHILEDRCCHNVVRVQDSVSRHIYYSGSLKGNIYKVGDPQPFVEIQPFLRGLHIHKNIMIAGISEVDERPQRDKGHGNVAVINMVSKKVLNTYTLPNSGNVGCVRIVDG